MGAENSKQCRHYADVLEHLKTYFPSPVAEAEISGHRHVVRFDRLRSAAIWRQYEIFHYESMDQYQSRQFGCGAGHCGTSRIAIATRQMITADVGLISPIQFDWIVRWYYVRAGMISISALAIHILKRWIS